MHSNVWAGNVVWHISPTIILVLTVKHARFVQAVYLTSQALDLQNFQVNRVQQPDCKWKLWGAHQLNQ